MNKELANWLEKSNESMQQQLLKLSPQDQVACFETSLEFGTAGVRGPVGPGTSNFNEYTVIKYVHGFAQFLKKKYENVAQIMVVLGSDSRETSRQFLIVAIQVLNLYRIKTYFEQVVPSPFIAYSIGFLGAHGGIVITASHNSRSDNGCKFYDEQGAQLSPESSSIVSNHAQNLLDVFELEYNLKFAPLLYNYQIENEVKIAYLAQIKNLRWNATKLQNREKSLTKPPLKILFSDLHGTTEQFVKELFANETMFEVLIDNSSPLKFTDPCQIDVFEHMFKVASEQKAALILLNDLDGDRIALAYLNEKNDYVSLSGNEIALVLLNFLLEHSTLTSDTFVVSSIVSSKLINKLCHAHHVKCYQENVGFKNLAKLINKYGVKNCLLAMEESNGLLVWPSTFLDKDGVQASYVLAMLAHYLQVSNLNFGSYLESIFKTHGVSIYKAFSTTLKGSKAFSKMQQVMRELHRAPVQTIKALKQSYGQGTKEVSPSDLVTFTYDDSSWMALRPSGTEPKLRFYLEAIDKNHGQAQKRLDELESDFNKLIQLFE